MKLTPVEFVRIAKALADPQRCEILERAAASGEVCCSHLLEKLSVSQATVSHHFKELMTAGLLERRKQGQFVFFRFRAVVLNAYATELLRRMRIRGR